MDPWLIRYQTPDGTLIHEEAVGDDFSVLPRVVFKGGACFSCAFSEVTESEPRVLIQTVTPIVPFNTKGPVYRDGDTEFYWQDGRLTKQLAPS